MLTKGKSFEVALHVERIGDFLEWWTSRTFVFRRKLFLKRLYHTHTQIHEGTSCNTHADVLGHYYDTSVDPWTTTWTSDSSGNGFGSFVVEAGYDVTQNVNRTYTLGIVINTRIPTRSNTGTIVTHLNDGTRSGCGVLSASRLAQPTFDCAVTATDLSAYPDYSGSIAAQGVVVVTDASSDSLELRYDISGLEASVSGGLHVRILISRNS